MLQGYVLCTPMWLHYRFIQEANVGERAAQVERWFFYQDVASLWKWARLDVFGTVLDHSGGSFATRNACLDDARRSGYGEEPVAVVSPAVSPSDRRSRSRRVHTARF